MNGLNVAVHRKSYPGCSQPVISGLEFAVERGEIVALVGPSGIGKSTLLGLIAGLDADYEGSIEWMARSVREAHVGFVFQEPRLMPWLTVRDNLKLAVPHAGNDVVDALLDEVGVLSHADAFPGQLSGGMQRRVALARAFAVRPELLMLDEPFASLDAPAAEALHEVLLELWRRDRPAVLVVTHDLREALTLADRVVFLSADRARVLHCENVELPRPRQRDGAAVAARYHELLRRYPGLLTGSVRPQPESAI